MTDLSGGERGHHDTNYLGVKNVIALARQAKAPLHFLSTAFCTREAGAERKRDSAYVQSKLAAERLVMESGLDWTIIRPSIVVGAANSGRISSFQGFHLFIASIVQGQLPFAPLNAGDICDIVPVDWVADAVREVCRTPRFGSVVWLTAGEAAPTIGELMIAARPFAAALGLRLDDLPMVDPATARRDVLPDLKRRLPSALRARLEALVDIADVMGIEAAFPSDLGAFRPAAPTKADMLAIFANTIRYWLAATNRSVAV